MPYWKGLVAATLLGSASPAAPGFSLRHFEYATVLRDAKSNIVGYATIEPSEDNKASDVTVQLKQEIAGTARVWEIRTGTCAKPGKVWGNPAAFSKKLIADQNGISKLKTTVAIELPETGDFHIQIKAPSGNTGKAALCSDFYAED